MKGKKFIASFSGGKDSMLAVYRGIAMGMEPMELITTYNIDEDRTWFHGIPKEILKRVSEEINIPISLIKTSGKDYRDKFKQKLEEALNDGAEICIFGDIDIEGHLEWCTELCNEVGIKAYFPLWKESRSNLVYEFIDLGFKTIITVIDSSRMDEKFVGKVLTRDLAKEMEVLGVDICGENGEYHSFVFDGPLFENPVLFKTGDNIYMDKLVIKPIKY